VATLRERLPAPCLGIVPRLDEATPAAVAAQLDSEEITRLLAPPP
jgi:dethiobiotin synthetase